MRLDSQIHDPSDLLCQNPNVLSAQVDQELALMSVARGRYYCLNATASDIWKRLEHPTPRYVLADALTRDYRGDREQSRSGLDKLIGQLLEEALLEQVNAG